MGFDITGWTWATVGDMNALFNHYIGSNQLGPGPGEYAQQGMQWQSVFWDDDWGQSSFVLTGPDEPPATPTLNRVLEGQTRDCLRHAESNVEFAHSAGVSLTTREEDDEGFGVVYGFYSTIIDVGGASCEEVTQNSVVAWFYRENT